MSRIRNIWFVLIFLCCGRVDVCAQERITSSALDFYGDSISVPFGDVGFVDLPAHLSKDAILHFCDEMESAHYEPVVSSLLAYREKAQLDDWSYYQLIRKTAETVSPKKSNYTRYTLYKWFFLLKSGYDAEISIAGDTILFYVQSDENIYDIPCHHREGKQYVCLNYHDYGYNLDFKNLSVTTIPAASKEARPFSYKLTHVASFKESDYRYKDIRFEYQDIPYHFKVKLNEQVKSMYANYPVADYQLYFNAPMSKETHDSFVPMLKEITSGMGTRNGIDYLMRFTRYAFLYQADKDNFGKEKRLSPEQTLLYEGSDCEDRAALFFFLVKEIYNLPMMVLAYPSHVTVAVRMDKAPGKPIIYNGGKYYICEPTPQSRDLGIGEVSKELSSMAYEVAYVYNP